jgi:hypothetical protein
MRCYSTANQPQSLLQIADPIEKFRGRKSEDADSGFIGLQMHTITVAFANIRIQK